jgi:hypothetical protein
LNISALTIILIGLMPLDSSADIFMKQKNHSDGFSIMGNSQPAKDLTTSIWITDTGIRSDNDEQSMILLLKKGESYMVNHKEKTYMVLSAKMGDATGGSSGEKADVAQFQNMMKNMMKIEISVESTGDKKKIGKWNCRRYNQTIQTMMGPMVSEIWASEDIKINTDVYAKYAASLFSAMPGMQSMLESLENEMKKVKGVTVFSKSTNTIMGQSIQSTTELLEVKEGKAPRGILEIPSGYKKIEMDARMQGR